ncbi:K(+) efflux antiporter 3, chloroplastic [Dendrobium catenatum]|uniref:K(+) efflux antiporter 3, chloroplastic n=1 Tax=Dendrobium catenatum TaxID=906689 RepID=UPI0009F60DD6|nr:K(+) efflux antiporter 3, chloroplastic [Dendrobium catenatum]
MGDSGCLSGGELCRHRISSLRTDHCLFYGIRRRFSVIPFFYKWKAEVLPSYAALRCRRWLRLVSVHDSGALFKRSSCGRFGLRGFRREVGTGFRIHAAIDVASAVDVINDLGLDTLTFLAVTVMVVPAFKLIRASPVSFVV